MSAAVAFADLGDFRATSFPNVIRTDTLLQPPFGRLLRISCG
jgi:hypothetical protein